MKTIEDRAHEILLKLVDVKELHKVKTKESACIIAENVWSIAEAMQAEAEKRKAKEDAVSLTKDKNGNFLHLHHEFGRKKCMDCGACLEEWQPDWSQAPEWAKYWTADELATLWWSVEPKFDSSESWHGGPTADIGNAPSFNYQGDWKDSLRKRP